MSRSRKRNPYCGVTTARSDKPYKRYAHKALRRAVSIALRSGEEAPPDRAFGDPWNGPKDGKLRRETPRAYRK